MNGFFFKNFQHIKIRFPEIAKELEKYESGGFYIGIQQAKTGKQVPVLSNGKLMHSKYNPEHEAEKIFDGKEEFVLFGGIGGGFQIEYFLKTFKDKTCAAFEYDYPSLKKLLELCDISQILRNQRFILLPPLISEDFEKSFISSYIPILFGGLSVKTLPAWAIFFLNKTENVLSVPKVFSTDIFSDKINGALEKIKADVSAQAVFGKIWMRNILLNLKTASVFKPKFPEVHKEKTAFILGAGPSLEEKLKTIKENRNAFVLFASDTAFRILTENKIETDFFVSIDPQVISVQHCFLPFPKNTTGIFDLCANPMCINRFLKNGNEFFFTASAHPLAGYASAFSPFPSLSSNSGTVICAALDAAKKLGFTNFEFAGADFAYTDGKAYARGSYLSALYGKDAVKTKTEETLFTDLMFRTEVFPIKNNGKITYKTKLLDGYKEYFSQSINSIQNEFWLEKDFSKFDFNSFVKKLEKDIKKQENGITRLFLPFFTWQLKTLNKKVTKEKLFFEIELVLQQILRYNEA